MKNKKIKLFKTRGDRLKDDLTKVIDALDNRPMHITTICVFAILAFMLW